MAADSSRISYASVEEKKDEDSVAEKVKKMVPAHANLQRNSYAENGLGSSHSAIAQPNQSSHAHYN